MREWREERGEGREERGEKREERREQKGRESEEGKGENRDLRVKKDGENLTHTGTFLLFAFFWFSPCSSNSLCQLTCLTLRLEKV